MGSVKHGIAMTLIAWEQSCKCRYFTLQAKVQRPGMWTAMLAQHMCQMPTPVTADQAACSLPVPCTVITVQMNAAQLLLVGCIRCSLEHMQQCCVKIHRVSHAAVLRCLDLKYCEHLCLQ